MHMSGCGWVGTLKHSKGLKRYALKEMLLLLQEASFNWWQPEGTFWKWQWQCSIGSCITAAKHIYLGEILGIPYIRWMVVLWHQEPDIYWTCFTLSSTLRYLQALGGLSANAARCLIALIPYFL